MALISEFKIKIKQWLPRIKNGKKKLKRQDKNVDATMFSAKTRSTNSDFWHYTLCWEIRT